MGIVPDYIETDPLNGMKDYKGESKKQEVNDGERICQDLAHITKIKNRPNSKVRRSNI
jgi:hypothetical protein